jgi:Arc/MetJ-type ribon-helix-helix transcriptional regulator
LKPALPPRLVAEGRFQNLSEACRAGLHRLDEEARTLHRLAALAHESLASGIDESFDFDTFIEATRTGA